MSGTYDKVVKADIEKVFNDLKILQQWVEINDLPDKVLYQLWLELDSASDCVYWKMKDKK